MNLRFLASSVKINRNFQCCTKLLVVKSSKDFPYHVFGLLLVSQSKNQNENEKDFINIKDSYSVSRYLLTIYLLQFLKKEEKAAWGPDFHHILQNIKQWHFSAKKSSFAKLLALKTLPSKSGGGGAKCNFSRSHYMDGLLGTRFSPLFSK